LTQIILEGRGFKFVQMMGISPHHGEIIAKEKEYTEFLKKKSLLQSKQTKLNQTWCKLSFGNGNSNLLKLRARSSSKGR
jgi:hypothetical protein